MTLTTSTKKSLDLKIIHDTLESGFVQAVLSSYEKNVWGVKFPCLPNGFYEANDGFYNDYHEPYIFLGMSIQRDMYEEDKWGDLTEDEQEDVDEELCSYAPRYEDLLMDDIRSVLDAYQLFYVNTSYWRNDNEEKSVIEMEIGTAANCPLQEVW